MLSIKLPALNPKLPWGSLGGKRTLGIYGD